MKKISLFVIFLTILLTAAFAQTADEVVNKFVEASGGKDKLNSITTLQYNQLVKLKLPMGEFDLPLQFYKDKNKLFRLQASLQFGSQSFNFYSLVSDTAGYVRIPANPMMGTEGGLKKMDEKDRAAQLFQMDVAGMFAALVDYKAKGHKVELLKDEKVKGQDSYKLKLTLKNGQEMTYFISKATNLVVRMDTKGAVAASMSGMGAVMSSMGGANRIEKMEVSTIYSDYKDVEGIKFPTKVLIKAPMGDSNSEVTNIKINKAIDPRLYKAS
jgi:hypothetical protein